MNLNYKKILPNILYIYVFWMLSYIATRDSSIINIILYPFIFITIYMIILIIHEISHFFTAIVCKANIIRLEIKSIEIRRINKKWNIYLKKNLNNDLSYEGCLFLKCDNINNFNEFKKCKRKFIIISLGGIISSIITFIVLIIIHKYFVNNIWIATSVLISSYILVSVVLGDLLMIYLMSTSKAFCLYMLLETDIISNSIESSVSKNYIIEQMIELLIELKNKCTKSNELKYALLCYNKLLMFSLAEGKKYISDDIFYYMTDKLYKMKYVKEKTITNVSLNENIDIVMNSILYCKVLNNDEAKANELIRFAKYNNILNLNDTSISNLLVKELIHKQSENKISQIINIVYRKQGSYKYLYMSLINRIMKLQILGSINM